MCSFLAKPNCHEVYLLPETQLPFMEIPGEDFFFSFSVALKMVYQFITCTIARREALATFECVACNEKVRVALFLMSILQCLLKI